MKRIDRILSAKPKKIKFPWAELKKEVSRYTNDVFEIGRGGDSMSVKDFVEGLKDGFESLWDLNIDYISDMENEVIKNAVEEIIRDFDLELSYDDVQALPEFDDLLGEVKINFNVEEIFPRSVFVTDPNELDCSFAAIGMTDEPADSAEFKQRALSNGFSEKDIAEVIVNATYGGVGGVGVICDTGKENMSGQAFGEMILYIRDAMNGSGMYVTGKSKSLQFKDASDLADHIDYGSYSLGDVFGADWSWR